MTLCCTKRLLTTMSCIQNVKSHKFYQARRNVSNMNFMRTASYSVMCKMRTFEKYLTKILSSQSRTLVSNSFGSSHCHWSQNNFAPALSPKTGIFNDDRNDDIKTLTRNYTTSPPLSPKSRIFNHIYKNDRIKTQTRNYATTHSQNPNSNNPELDKDPLHKYLRTLEKEYLDLLENSDVAGVKERGLRMVFLKPIANLVTEMDSLSKEIAEIDGLLAGLSKDDKEMREMGEKEKCDCVERMGVLEEQAIELLTLHEVTDKNDVILEVTAGVGGLEAMLFTNDVFNMYQRYAVYCGWASQVVNFDLTEQGGLRHASVSLSGVNVYGRLKYEGGVHRVQRVPTTEKSGRVHTSTVTVAVLPQPNDIDIEIKPKDLKVDAYKASGAGGQSVSTSDSAVRILHIPTGTVVACQTERSQMKNHNTALKILKTKWVNTLGKKLYQAQLDKQTNQTQSQRKIQIGSGGRSEKIRTYNYNQDRVTDHRIGVNVYNLPTFLFGEQLLDGLVENVHSEAKREQLLEILQGFNCGTKR